MPNITLTTDFQKGELKIPNAVSQNAGEGINGDLQAIIDKYEKKVLLAVLGKSQYDVLQTKLDDLENAEQYWQDLVNDYLKDLLTNYIYCQWLKFDYVKLSTVGAGKGKSEGYQLSDTDSKYVDRFNEFVDWFWKLEEHLRESENLEIPDDFPMVHYANTITGHSIYDTI